MDADAENIHSLFSNLCARFLWVQGKSGEDVKGFEVRGRRLCAAIRPTASEVSQAWA